MAESSWLPEEASRTTYRFDDGRLWIVQHEYQPDKCADCGREQYCRLTHIWPVGAQQHMSLPFYHINRGADLAELKKVTVQYLVDGERNVAVREVETPDGWVLEADGAVIARELSEG